MPVELCDKIVMFMYMQSHTLQPSHITIFTSLTSINLDNYNALHQLQPPPKQQYSYGRSNISAASSATGRWNSKKLQQGAPWYTLSSTSSSNLSNTGDDEAEEETTVMHVDDEWLTLLVFNVNLTSISLAYCDVTNAGLKVLKGTRDLENVPQVARPCANNMVSRTTTPSRIRFKWYRNIG
jgi:hypothetical protein